MKYKYAILQVPQNIVFPNNNSQKYGNTKELQFHMCVYTAHGHQMVHITSPCSLH